MITDVTKCRQVLKFSTKRAYNLPADDELRNYVWDKIKTGMVICIQHTLLSLEKNADYYHKWRYFKSGYSVVEDYVLTNGYKMRGPGLADRQENRQRIRRML